MLPPLSGAWRARAHEARRSFGADGTFPKSVGKVNVIYFQDAVLDPIKMLEKIERVLGVTLIASNPAMFCHVRSRAHLAYPLQGYGRLLQERLKLGS